MDRLADDVLQRPLLAIVLDGERHAGPSHANSDRVDGFDRHIRQLRELLDGLACHAEANVPRGVEGIGAMALRDDGKGGVGELKARTIVCEFDAEILARTGVQGDPLGATAPSRTLGIVAVECDGPAIKHLRDDLEDGGARDARQFA